MQDHIYEAIKKAASTDAVSGDIEVSGETAAKNFQTSWFFCNNTPFKGELSKAHGSYVGIFKKNIEVTDITHPETIVLFRKFTKTITDESCSPLFHTTKDCLEIIEKSILPDNIKIFSNKDGNARCNFEAFLERRPKDFVNFYGSIFEKIVIIDFKRTSFSSHIPKSLSVDLRSIVSESGYIHSLGNHIYVRRARKASISEIKKAIKLLITTFNYDSPAYITAYSPEFFNSEELKSSESMSNGLDGIKLSARKHHIGELSIIEAVPALVEACNGDLGFPALYSPTTDDYGTERKKRDFAPKFTIFLIQDRSLVYSKTDRQLNSGSEIYLLCYAQRIKNENPLHIFKESKPGWHEPVTMPHTLSGALINIATGRLPNRQLIALDPFCGSSTTLLDVMQRFPDSKIIGFDRNPNSIRISQENFEFFSRPDKSIVDLLEQLIDLLGGERKPQQLDVPEIANEFREIQKNADSLKALKFPVDNDPEGERDRSQALNKAIAFVFGAIARNSTNEYNTTEMESVNISAVNFTSINKFVEGDGPFTKAYNAETDYPSALSTIKAPISRHIIYAIWRAIYYSSFRFQNDLDQTLEVIKKEFISQKIRYTDLFKYSNRKTTEFGDNVYFDGLFSEYVKPNDENVKFDKHEIDNSQASNLENLLTNLNSGQRLNFLQVENSILAMKKLIDLPDDQRPNLIVTDPPYGFNTDEYGPSSIEEMFSELGPTLFDVVAPDGVIAITLPGQSRNGKDIPFYETRGMFVRKLLDYAGSSRRSIVSKASILPDSSSFPRPAFRWAAEKGVSRHALIFQVK